MQCRDCGQTTLDSKGWSKELIKGDWICPECMKIVLAKKKEDL